MVETRHSSRVRSALWGSALIAMTAGAAQRTFADDAVRLRYETEANGFLRLTVTELEGAGASGTTWTLSADAAQLEALVQEYRELAVLRPPASLGRLVRLGDELGRLLLDPAADILRTASRLVLSIEAGPLTELPFAAVRAPRSIDPDGRFLTESRVLCWLDPALSTEAEPGDTADTSEPSPIALVAADAIYRPPGRPLGASMSDGGISWRVHAARRHQANAVGILDHPIVRLFGEEATPQALWREIRGNDVRVLHLAVEAFIDRRHPGRSALLLSPPRYDDPPVRVTAAQIADELEAALDRQALVVLSGLDTGGHLSEGSRDGPGPLIEAFAIAGAGTAVASLWPVVDESATRLFEELYRHLAKDPGAPAEALQAAQVRLLAAPLRFGDGQNAEPAELDASHPFHWAGYRVVRGTMAGCR